MSSSNTTTVNPINCVYGCNTRICWNNLINEYWEVLTKKNIHVLKDQAMMTNSHQQYQLIIILSKSLLTIIKITTIITIIKNHGLSNLIINNRWITL